MRSSLAPRLLAVLAVSVVPAVAQEDALAPVRTMYASAEYETALAELSRLATHPGGPSLEMDRYRLLCLVALGRSTEATTVIERLVADQPLFDPASLELPPRVRTAFQDARQRILPGIARRLYGEGKNAFEKKAFDEAAVRLGQAVRVMEVLDGGDESLADLRTLAAGFLDLAKASAATPEAPSAPAAAAAPAALAAPAPPVSLPISGPARGPATRAAVPTTVPVVVQQELPPWPAIARGPLFQGQFRGMIEIDIDERGDVVGVDIIEPIHPTYDAVLLKAAWDWKYRPATLDGQPVKSQKRVEVVLRP